MAHRIMIVDDEVNILRALQRLLAAPDVEVETFSQPEEALRRAQVTAFDLFMVDYRMPRMDGLALLHELAQLQQETLRMIISGIADFDMVVKAVNEAGIHRFVPKPWNDEEVKVSVRTALEKHRLEVENRRLADELRRSEAIRKRQEAELDRLERQNPGITKVDWADDGSIPLSED